MFKKSEIDFVIYEDNDEMLIFRFLPMQSSCHSFNDNPPTKWEEVYKVYYAYKIFRRWKDDDSIEEVFYCGCDECSIIDEISARIKYIVDGKKTFTTHRGKEEYTFELLDAEVIPFGDGVSWTITEIIDMWTEEKAYGIVLWKYDEYGYRFRIEKDKLKEFGEYLNECCEYMLAHGDPI